MRDKIGDAAWVFLLLAFAYGYFAPDPGWNGYSRVALVYALVEERRLEIDTYAASTGDRAVYGGHNYSDKAIGTSLLGAAAYAPLYGAATLLGIDLDKRYRLYAITLLAIGLPSAGAGVLFYRLSRRLGSDRWHAYLMTIAYGLGTLAFPFSTMLFGHQLAAAALFAAFYLIFLLRDVSLPARRRHTGAIGALLGFAIITEFPTAVAAFALALYYLHVMVSRRELRRRDTVIVPTLVGLVPIGLQLAYNSACFGSPLANAYAFHAEPAFRTGMARGLGGIGLPSLTNLYYMTIHPARGIFWQAPFLLYALVGLVLMVGRRRWRAEGLVMAWMVLAFLLLYSGYFMWWGGYSFGIRHLVAMLPFLAIGGAVVPWHNRWVAVALVLISAAFMLAVTAQNPLVPDDMEGFLLPARPDWPWPVVHYNLPQLFQGNVARSLGTALGIPGVLSLGPFLVGVGILVAGFATARPIAPVARSRDGTPATLETRAGSRGG